LQQKYFCARPEYELHQDVINVIADGFQIAYAGMKHQEHLRLFQQSYLHKLSMQEQIYILSQNKQTCIFWEENDRI
jgi:hypothetical protein